MNDHPKQYEPKHGDLVFLTYINRGRTKTARAMKYRGKYIGIETKIESANDPVVKLFDIDPFTVEDVSPLESQANGPTNLEKSVRIAIEHSEKYITVDMYLKKR